MVDVIEWWTDGYRSGYVRWAMDRELKTGELFWVAWSGPKNDFVL